MEIERRRRAVAGEYRGHALHGLDQAHQGLGDPCQHMSAALREQRRIAQELQRVAETLLMRQQHGAAGQVAGFRYRGKQKFEWERDRALDVEAPLEVRPSLGPTARLQQCHGPVDPDLRVRRRRGYCPRIGGDRPVELPLDLQQHAEVGPTCRLRGIGRHGLVEMPDRFLVMA
jgi:hypothetical protein